MSKIEKNLAWGVVFAIVGVFQYGVIANLALAWIISLACFSVSVYKFFNAGKMWYDSQT